MRVGKGAFAPCPPSLSFREIGGQGANAPLTTLQTLKRRARLRLFFPSPSSFGLARHRHDTQRGDAVALAAQHAEAEAVESKTLAAFGNRARLVDYEAGDGGRLLIREMPVHRAVKVADRHR